VKLPAADRAVVDERKVREYLLSHSHPIGRFKAAFFARAGFRAENWHEFASAVRDLALRGDAVRGEPSEYGSKYLISGTIMGPQGIKLEVTAVWLIPTAVDVPRLVTVFPR
jgi:hypothetical protein